MSVCQMNVRVLGLVSRDYTFPGHPETSTLRPVVADGKCTLTATLVLTPNMSLVATGFHGSTAISDAESWLWYYHSIINAEALQVA